jgi:hypothetical protein
MLGNYRVAAQLVASRVVLSSTELVSFGGTSNIATYSFIQLSEYVQAVSEGALIGSSLECECHLLGCYAVWLL